MSTQILDAWRRIRHSAVFYGAMATVIRVGANILLLPFVLSKLSQAELALWWVFLALGACASLGDFGFGQAILRVYSYLWAGADDFDVEGLRPPPEHGIPNLHRIRQLNLTAGRLYLYISTAAIPLLAAVGTFVLLKPVRTVGEPVSAWLCWSAYLLVVVFTLGSSHWIIACQGINRVRELQVAQLWSSLAYVVSAAALLRSGVGLAALVIATGIRGLLIRQLCRRAYFKAVPPCRAKRTEADSRMLAKLWPNARKFGVITFGSYLISNSNVLISSQLLGDEITASFGLTAQVGLFLTTFSGLWLNVKWPEITILRTQGKLETMAVLFARRLSLVMVTFVVLSVMGIVTGNALLSWKGTHTRLLATPYLILYLTYLAQQLFYTEFGLLAFTENVVIFYRISFFTAVGLIGLSLWLTGVWGLWGLLLAPLAAELACSTWYPVIRGFKGQPLSLRQFFRASIYGRV